MEARYARNIPALTGAECEILRQKRVLVVGCGGLGGHIIDQLARIGVGAIRAVDGDVFEETNLNRQFLSSVPLLGVSKAKAAADHIAAARAGADGGNTAGACILTLVSLTCCFTVARARTSAFTPSCLCGTGCG